MPLLITHCATRPRDQISALYRVFLWQISANSDLFVCCCRTWMCLDITRLYEEQLQPSSGSAWSACPKTVNRAPLLEAGGFDTSCTAACQNRSNNSITCRLCRLEHDYGCPNSTIDIVQSFKYWGATTSEVAQRILLITTVNRRKFKWYGHVLRYSGILKISLQGLANGSRRGVFREIDGTIPSNNRRV